MAVLPYALFSAGLLGALGLFVSLKRELARQRRSLEKQIAELAAELNRNQRIAASRGGMTAQKREQALQLLRQGADAAGIAGTLELPRREIELLLRIQRN